MTQVHGLVIVYYPSREIVIYCRNPKFTKFRDLMTLRSHPKASRPVDVANVQLANVLKIVDDVTFVK